MKVIAEFVGSLITHSWLAIDLVHITASLSDTVTGTALGLLIAVLVAFLASVRRLALLLIRFAEAIAKHRIEQWASQHGVDSESIVHDDDN